MELWIARNDGGTLELHRRKPSISKVTGSPMWIDGGFVGFIFNDLFPEVTFENSPQEVELKLCHQTETIKIADCNPKAQPCVLTNHGIDTNVVKFD